MKVIKNQYFKKKKKLESAKRMVSPNALHHPPMRSRLDIFQILIAIGFIVVLVRSMVIQVFPPSEKALTSIASRQYNQHLKVSQNRGKILDTRGEPLAISILKPSLAVNPRVFKPTHKELKKLSSKLNISSSSIAEISKKTNYFAWLKRKVSNETASAIVGMGITGLYQIDEPARYYPLGRDISHLLGRVNIDNRGLSGLELRLEKILANKAQKIAAVRDGRGKILLDDPTLATAESSGSDIYLTIDKVIQKISADALRQGIQNANAKSGFVIVGNPHTGEILASVSYPDFHPEERSSGTSKKFVNKALKDVFEPGSVVKPFVVGRAIDLNKVGTDEKLNCEKSGIYRFPGGRISDDHPKEFLNPSEVLIHSSNICTFKIAERIGSKELYRFYTRLGFGVPYHSDGYLKATTGRLSHFSNWKPIRFANISFGQGHSVNGLDLLRSFSAIANGGRLIKPFFLKRNETNKNSLARQGFHLQTDEGQKIFSLKTAEYLKNSLHEVSKQGTGREAATKSYTVSGKTGTAEKYDPNVNGYSEHARIASFAGFSPHNDPKITVIVVIDEPGKKPYYGGLWAAPIFSKIVEQTLHYLNVPPNKPPKNIGRFHSDTKKRL